MESDLNCPYLSSIIPTEISLRHKEFCSPSSSKGLLCYHYVISSIKAVIIINHQVQQARKGENTVKHNRCMRFKSPLQPSNTELSGTV